MSINHEALADKSADNEVFRIGAGELEPYRAEIEAWINAGRPGGPYRRQELESIIESPSFMVETIPALFKWMRDNHRGPWAPKEEVVTVAGGFHVGDRVASRGGVEGTVVPAPHEQNYGNVVWFAGRGSPTYAFPNYFTLVSCPHEIDPDPAGLADGRPAPEGYIPWGPDHPDWHPFWDKAEAFAKKNRYCDEYERIVAEVGGRPLATTEEIEVEALVRFTVTAPITGATIDALEMLSHHNWDSLRVQESHVHNRRPIYRRNDDV